MAQTISAEEGALQRGAQAVNTAKAGIDQQVKRVQGEIQEVVGSAWGGQASLAYGNLLQRWNEETTKLNSVLVTLEDALTGTDRDQSATEESHQQTIGNLSSMMGS